MWIGLVVQAWLHGQLATEEVTFDPDRYLTAFLVGTFARNFVGKKWPKPNICQVVFLNNVLYRAVIKKKVFF